MEGVRKLLVLCLSSLLFSLYAVSPVSQFLGEVQTAVVPGSITETALEAVREEYTEDWLDKYTSDPMVFAEAYSEELGRLLPFDTVLAGKEKNGGVTLLDQKSGTAVAFNFTDGKISAFYPVRIPSASGTDEEGTQSNQQQPPQGQ